MSLIPYRCWTRVHGRHHKWTGWQDLDPTTESLVPRRAARVERAMVNVCWRFGFRCSRSSTASELLESSAAAAAVPERGGDRRAMQRDALALLAALRRPRRDRRSGDDAPHRSASRCSLSLVLEDLLLLSQHTHVPQNVSHGDAGPAVPGDRTGQFTRSLRLPRWRVTRAAALRRARAASHVSVRARLSPAPHSVSSRRTRSAGGRGSRAPSGCREKSCCFRTA